MALLSVALNFLLVPHYGLIGAATATSVALMTGALMNNVVVSRTLGIEVAVWRNLLKQQSAGLISPAAVALTSASRSPTSRRI